MDAKSIHTLEYQKILERLGSYTAFSASATLVRALQPTNDLLLAQDRQARTTQARRLLDEYPETSIGGARDVRPQVEMASRGGVLAPEELIRRSRPRWSPAATCSAPSPNSNSTARTLQAIAQDLTPPPGIIEAITQIITDNAEVADGASVRLDSLRREVKAANDRIFAKLEKADQ